MCNDYTQQRNNICFILYNIKMKNTNLEKKPLVERYGKDLRSVGIVTAL